jgi:hypothetical protein
MRLMIFCRWLHLIPFFVWASAGLSDVIDFNAIVVANSCTGFIVRLDSSSDSDAALVLTNGHCSSAKLFMLPNTCVWGKESKQVFKLRSNEGNCVRASLKANRLLYRTMTGTDIALYQLKNSYADLAQRLNVKPLTLSRERPERKAEIALVSGLVPLYPWGRIYHCSIDGFAHRLQEGGWEFADAIRYSSSGCDTPAGTSGAPVIDKNTRQVVGIHSTKNLQGDACTLNNPCEKNKNGLVTVRPGAAYAQQTYQIYTCFDSNNKFDLSLPECVLFK